MNIITYLFCLIAGLLGIVAHILFVDLPRLKKASTVGNAPFSVSSYFSDSWLAIASSVFTIIVFAFILDELVKWQPVVLDWLKWLFIFIGYTGSSILQAALGKTGDKINAVIDLKTDIADGKTTV